jgi:hypothetical protein
MSNLSKKNFHVRSKLSNYAKVKSKLSNFVKVIRLCKIIHFLPIYNNLAYVIPYAKFVIDFNSRISCQKCHLVNYSIYIVNKDSMNGNKKYKIYEYNLFNIITLWRMNA